MTNEQILKKAIEKVVKNGWKGLIDFNYLALDLSGVIVGMWHIEKIIFSLDFAKAFWGDNIPITEIGLRGKIIGYDIPKDNQIKYWQLCLQQLVLAKDKFKYLEKFL